MLWDYMKTLIMLRSTLEPPYICTGCKRGRRASQSFRQDRTRIAPAKAEGTPLPVYSGGRERLTERAQGSAGPAVAAGIVPWRGCNWREREESQSVRSIDLADAKLEVAF